MSSISISESFKKRADSAAFYEAWVGAVLARAGLWTVHHPFNIAQTSTEIESFGTTWDLDVCKTDPFAFMRSPAGVIVQVEVKSVNSIVRGPGPLLGKTLVCSQKSWLKKWPKASHTQRSFLFVDRNTGSIRWLPANVKVELGVEVYDSSRNESYKAVAVSSLELKDLQGFVDYVKGA